jgi:hypothetical protein
MVFAGMLAAAMVIPAMALAAEKPASTKAAAPAVPPEMQQMMEMMEKLGAPGPQHAELMKGAGKWKAVTKTWMGPGDPVVTEGVSMSKATLGGRFLMDEYKGTFMSKPFEGVGLTGYDNQRKEYIGFWFDTMSTHAMTSRGSMDASGKVLTMMSEFEDPGTGEKAPVKMVTTFVDPNTRRFEMYENQGGQEVKSMEITYTRMK